MAASGLSFEWATKHNKQDGRQKKRFGGNFNCLSLVQLVAAFSVLGNSFALYLSFFSVDVTGK